MKRSKAKAPAVVIAAAFATLIFLPDSARALTGEDVLDTMNAAERSAYIAGNVDMAAQLSYHQGKRERSSCIFDWYYEGSGIEQILQALERFRDRQVQPVVHALINRACGE